MWTIPLFTLYRIFASVTPVNHLVKTIDFFPTIFHFYPSGIVQKIFSIVKDNQYVNAFKINYIVQGFIVVNVSIKVISPNRSQEGKPTSVPSFRKGVLCSADQSKQVIKDIMVRQQLTESFANISEFSSFFFFFFLYVVLVDIAVRKIIYLFVSFQQEKRM